MLLPKRQRQIDFVTANDHANSAIIARRRTVLTQAMHRLPTAKNAFMRAFKICTVKEQRPGFTLSETGGHCRRDQNSGGGHLGRHLYHHDSS